MSPFSFFSSFAFPTFPAISVPTIGSYLPENIQKRLVSYLLQRTLGKFVAKDGLQLERIEAEINQGWIRLEGLQIDVESVNAILPPDSAYRIREGHLDTIDISLPFPNVWSGPLSLNISSVQIVLESSPPFSSPSASSSCTDSPGWDLNESIHDASDDFIRTALNQEEEIQLYKSVYDFQRTAAQESPTSDLDPFATSGKEDYYDTESDGEDDPFPAPGGFPTRTSSSRGAGSQGGSTAAMVESLIETLLARLQVVIGQIVVRYHQEIPDPINTGSSSINLDFRLYGIRYALKQPDPSATPKKTLTISDMSLWLNDKKSMDGKMTEALIRSDDSSEKGEIDMMMSFGIADLRESRYEVQDSLTGSRHHTGEQDEDEDAGPAQSLYESAIGDTQQNSPVNTSPGNHQSPVTGSKSLVFPVEGTKIFGIQKGGGVVIQMWKETLPINVEPDIEGNSSRAPSQARISVQLGRMAFKLDNQQLKPVMTLIGSFVQKPQRARSKEADSRPAPTYSRSWDTRLQILLTSFDLHFLYDNDNDHQHPSSTEMFWETFRPEVIQEDHLHLRISTLAIAMTEADGTTADLGGISLLDVHKTRTRIAKAELLAQPLLMFGAVKLPSNAWLPCLPDIMEQNPVSLSENEEDTHFKIQISKAGEYPFIKGYLLPHLRAPLFELLGKSIQLGHIHLFLDPAVVSRLLQPLRHVSTVYTAAFSSSRPVELAGYAANTYSDNLHVHLGRITLKMYCTSDVNGDVRPHHRPKGKLTVQLKAISFNRYPDAAVQATLDSMLAIFEDDISANVAATWLRCGTAPAQGVVQRALDLSYLPNRSKRISMAISILAFDLDQQISHGLQYFVDDYTTWLDGVLSSANTPTMVESQPVVSQSWQPDDATFETESIDSSVPSEEILQIECVILKAVMSIEAHDRTITLEASDIDATVHAIAGSKKGNTIDCTIFSLEMSETDRGTSSTKTVLRSDMRDNARAGLDVRPVIVLCFASTEDQETRYKESIISVNLSNTFFSITPGIPWALDLRSVLSSPTGVFENMVPSDSTKATIVVQDCTAFLPASQRQGAISIDVGHFSLSDNYTISNTRKTGTDALKHEDYDFALCCLLRESRLLFCLGPGAKTKVDISYASIDVPLCADTQETFQEVIRDISEEWGLRSKDTMTTPLSRASTPSGEEPVSDIKSLLGSLSDLAPSLTASSFEEDLLRDDLPKNADFVRGSLPKTSRAGVSQHGSERHDDSIRVIYHESFDLYQDFMTRLEETVHRNDDSGGSSLVISGNAINLRILLHSGYDWQATRVAVESETEALRRRLRKLSRLISSGNAPTPDLRRTHVELFNSIHIGIRDDEEYQDDDQLLAAINDELADLDSETASTTTYKTQGPGRADAGSFRNGSGRQKKLSRSRRPQMEIFLRDTAFRYTVEDPSADVVSSFKLTLQKAEIIDHIKSSTWKSFMTAMKKSSTHDIVETEAKMLRILVDWVNPGLKQMPEARVNIEVAPLRFHIDQDALDFMKRFFSFTRTHNQVASPSPESPKLNSKSFIQHVEIQPILVKMDYKPKRLNLKALQQGSAMEVINLFHFESATMTLRHVSLNGVSSWGELYSNLLAIWTPDVKANQMSDLLTGIAPVRSMVKAGSGVADLILLPLEQYRKDGKIVKGMRRGASSFASNTLSEVATVGAQLATGTQVILERAERALGGRQPEYPDLPDMMESINLTEYEAGQAGKTSRYANQPANVNQGIAAAYSSLASNFASAAQTILAVPMEVLEQTGDQTVGFTSIASITNS
ncbi:hypothetical protein QFC19_007466 [Naganishia cerealis]|uniref:Uncharacterized protein n=1 Tax=Naganishia cerealis TaxID=610337 RepID=A0ACC2V8R0_9TREE|nr:hypothetical protein QFC19_007466 [Naganishia cerealis]